MDRAPDQCTFRQKAAGCAGGQRFFTKLHTVCANGYGHVDAFVDQQQGLLANRLLQLFGKGEQPSARQFLGPKLNQPNATRNRQRNAVRHVLGSYYGTVGNQAKAG